MMGIYDHQPVQTDEQDDYFQTSDVLIDEFMALHPDESGLNTTLAGYRKLISSNPLGLNGEDHEVELRKLTAYYEAVHKFKKNDKEPGQTALCLSGGGIRSAAFALGVMQGLAHLNLLSKFDYLSTVSGGGYIGGWFSAWVARAEKDKNEKEKKSLDQVADMLAQIQKPEGMRVASEPEPLVQLRKNQAFITPKVGLGSPDTWAALAIVIRNLLLNWVVFIPFIGAVLFIPRVVEWFFVSWTQSKEQSSTFLIDFGYRLWDIVLGRTPQPVSCVDIASWHYWLDTIGVFFVIISLVSAIVNRFKPPKDSLDEYGFVTWVMMPLILGAVMIVTQSSFWVPNGKAPNSTQLIEWIAFGSVIFVVAFLLAIMWWWVSRIRYPEREKIGALTPADVSKGIVEVVAQFFSGALIGALIWSGLWLRHKATAGHPELTPKYDAVFGVPWYLASFLLGQVLLAALTSRLYHLKSSVHRTDNILNPMDGDRYREWWARANGFYGAAAIAWVFTFGIVIFGWELVKNLRTETILALTGGSGALSLLGASPLSPALKESLKGVKLSINQFINIASIVFVICLAIGIAHGSALLLQEIVQNGLILEPTGPTEAVKAVLNLKWTFIAGLVLLFFSIAASYFINVNYFSLNSMYRNRLVRTFLGASNARAEDRNKFDGFAASDNLSVFELLHATPKLFHVINITLNLTGSDNNAWQERKATPFICTPLHTGGHLVGYRSSKFYCEKISLGTALSLSGAAVSPNWGYHSSPVTSFVLTVFNARLGGWFGNPASELEWKGNGPDRSYSRFWQEALGFTTYKEPYVYLSDGGHFENLGLYEMIRRRCHIIVLSDAGADPTCTLEDLGNAIRKIYIDLGVEIDFERIDVRARDAGSPKEGIYSAIGKIRYPDKDAKEGRIIYIKPGLYEDAPADVKAYAAANAKFPHDATLNQWFTESQFESYRALGEHAIKMMTGLRDPAGKATDWPPCDPEIVDLLDFYNRVEDYLRKREPLAGGSA